MKLSEFVRPQLIKVGLEAEDKWEAITQLIDLMVDAEEIKPEDRDKTLSP